MDGENNGTPYSNGWFGGTTIQGNTHILIEFWGSKDYCLNGPSEKDHCFLVGIYNQRFQGTTLLMAFDFQNNIAMLFLVVANEGIFQGFVKIEP